MRFLYPAATPNPSTREHALSRIRTLIAVLAIAIPVPVAVAACGSESSSNDEDPQQVLKETFDNPTKVTSGHLNISLSGSAEGTQSGSLTATIDGPFQSDETSPDTLPQLDLAAKLSASGAGQSFSFDGSVITTEDNAYVEYQDQAYEVGTAIFKRFTQAYQQSASKAQAEGGQNASTIFKRFGVDPTTWLTNLSNEGTTDVEGTDTIHVHGDANVPQILSDIQKIAQNAGERSGPDAGSGRPGRVRGQDREPRRLLGHGRQGVAQAGAHPGDRTAGEREFAGFERRRRLLGHPERRQRAPDDHGAHGHEAAAGPRPGAPGRRAGAAGRAGRLTATR